jgi:putative membrane protein
VDLTDGEWHRLHPLTPLLRGGLFLLVVLGWVVNSLRDRLLNLVIPGGHSGGDEGDPVDYVVEHDYVGWALLGLLLLLVVLIGLFTLAWRMHTFRVTGEVVEVRSGVLFRNHRKARLDRIQGINVARPFVARLFGTARLEISQAGNDAHVRLEYLGSAAADDLRRRILQLASGARAEDVRTGRRDPGLPGRVDDFLAPELDPQDVRATSVVRVHQGRIIGSIALSGATAFIVLAVAAIVVSIALTGQYFLLVSLFPALIGAGGYYIRRVTKTLQYSIAATEDGIRIGYGLVSLTNETLPPGRIHAVSVNQPLLWRPFGWWDVRINRASHGGGNRQSQQVTSIVLPVGDAADVRAVLEMLLPELIGTDAAGTTVSVVDESLTTSGDVGGFTRSPRRGAWLRPLSWRRNGYRFVPGAVLFRLGAIWRSLVVVPLPRVQSVRVAQGPVERTLRLAKVHVHTVHGPVIARAGALDTRDAMALWADTESLAIAAAAADTSHRWRSGSGLEARPASDPLLTRPVPPDWVSVPPVGGDA